MIKDFGCNYEGRWLLRRRIAVENSMRIVLWTAWSHETLLFWFCLSLWVALGPHTADVCHWLLQYVVLQSGRTFHSCPCSVNDVLVSCKTQPWNTQLKPWRSQYWCQLLQLFDIDKKLNWKRNLCIEPFNTGHEISRQERVLGEQLLNSLDVNEERHPKAEVRDCSEMSSGSLVHVR